jgi:hypothetical protein
LLLTRRPHQPLLPAHSDNRSWPVSDDNALTSERRPGPLEPDAHTIGPKSPPIRASPVSALTARTGNWPQPTRLVLYQPASHPTLSPTPPHKSY